MSNPQDELTHAIHDLICKYLADQGGGMVNGFHLVADVIDSDGDASWFYCAPHNQSQMLTLGLLEWSRNLAKVEQEIYLKREIMD